MPRSEYTYGTPAYSRRMDHNNHRINHNFCQYRADARRDESERRNSSRVRSSHAYAAPTETTDLEGINSPNPATRIFTRVAWVLFGIVVCVLILIL